MLLTLYVLFLAIAFLTIGLSIWVKEPYYALVGFFFLFYISVALMTDGIDYQTGETEVSTYTYDNGTLNQTALSRTTVNSTYTNTYTWWFGFLLSITSGFSFAFVSFDLRRDRGLERAKEIGEAP